MLFRLDPNAGQAVSFQQTTFSTDFLGRAICNTWDEAVNNGGRPFDFVVLGAGMFGGYCAEKIYRFSEGLNSRILVLDAGSFLATQHLQNIPNAGLNAPGAAVVPNNASDPGTQSAVWGYPWHSAPDFPNGGFPGLAYCLGGRSLFWGGWSPRLTENDLANWPADAADYLRKNYAEVESDLGVTLPAKANEPTSSQSHFMLGQLHDVLKPVLDQQKPAGIQLEEAPLAVEGQSPEPGLFAFDKYSSINLLTEAVREDIQKRLVGGGFDNSKRRLFVVPRAHAIRLITSNGQVVGIQLSVDGQPQTLWVGQQLAQDFKVVLSSGTIESTRLALESFPVAGMGSNLMAHLRSNIAVRIKSSAIPNFPANLTDLETTAFLLRGESNGRRFHVQVTAAVGSISDANLYTAIPDMDLLSAMVQNQDSNWVSITFRCIGEMKGTPTLTAPDGAKNLADNWVNLTSSTPDQTDEFSMRRAWVNLSANADDNNLSIAMEQACLDLALKIAGGSQNIQYHYNNAWNSQPPASGTSKDGLGTTHHEAGTLWMGAPGQSITDSDGKFHQLQNAYAAGPALFPAIGSANPSLTGSTLARKTAERIIGGAAVSPGQVNPGFNLIFDGIHTQDWRMSTIVNQPGRDNPGRFTLVDGALQSQPGTDLGLLWYTKPMPANFILKLEWQSLRQDDNSGVFIRFPNPESLGYNNNAWVAIDKGFEIQIDDRAMPDGASIHKTGAIYSLAGPKDPVHLPVKSLGQWNQYEIHANGQDYQVWLNGQLVTEYQNPDSSRGLPSVPGAPSYIGLQGHTGQVAFRNIQVKELAPGAGLVTISGGQKSAAAKPKKGVSVRVN